MAHPLSTPQRVRDRIGVTEEEVNDAVLDGFIADQQAYLEVALRRTFAEDEPGYELARRVVTDLAAALALGRLTGGAAAGTEYRVGKLSVSKRAELAHRRALMEALRGQAGAGLDALRQLTRRRGFSFVGPD
ncbi:MAG: hypothetical protein LC624_08305 [Halobacteriales archaeon]|nr:hypothetical protein [Halobacteriales archaeon]